MAKATKKKVATKKVPARKTVRKAPAKPAAKKVATKGIGRRRSTPVVNAPLPLGGGGNPKATKTVVRQDLLDTVALRLSFRNKAEWGLFTNIILHEAIKRTEAGVRWRRLKEVEALPGPGLPDAAPVEVLNIAAALQRTEKKPTKVGWTIAKEGVLKQLLLLMQS